MLKWAPYPFVRITLSFIAGILFYILTGKQFDYGFELLAFFFSCYLAAFFYAHKHKAAPHYNVAGSLGLLTFFALGVFVTHTRTAAHKAEHLLHVKSEPSHYLGVVEDYVVQKPAYQSTVLKVTDVLINGVWQKASGKVQLSVPHDSERAYEIGYGDVLLIKGSPQAVPAPANPDQFNYQEFLANRHIYHRHFLQRLQFIKLGNDPPLNVLYGSIMLRRKLDDIFKTRLKNKREYSIASALLLGVKDELDNSIRNTYASTGTMHVLAVSGLHVGLIFSVLMLLLSRLNRTVWQRLLGASTILAALWTYAFISGLSPSVLRAVLMFSLVTVGMTLNRRTNIYNTLSIAALVLLFINPYNLLEVGFQLSFLAVLGIVFLQPKLYNLLEVDNWLLDKVWALFTVAIAAQLATSTLGLFYFHQFPVYFWLANVVVVPLATVVLYAGIIALIFSWIPVISTWVFLIYDWLIWLMNEFNLLVEQLPGALINGIDISLMQTILLHLILIMAILFFAKKKLYYLTYAVMLIGIVSTLEVWEVMQQKRQQVFTVYHVHGSTGIAKVQGREATFLADSALLADEDNYTFNVLPHLRANGISQTKFVNLHQSNGENLQALPDKNQLLMWEGKSFLVISQSPKLVPQDNFKVNYLLLRNNPRIRAEGLSKYNADLIILDASNKPWYRRQLKPRLDSLGLNYYDVAEQGAFILTK